MIENSFDIPPHWQIAKLGELCQVVTGTTPSKLDKSNYGQCTPFFKPPHLHDNLLYDTDEKLSLKGSLIARVVPPNTVLVTCIGNLGRTGLLTKESAFNQQLNAILENEYVTGKFLFYQSQSPKFRKQLEILATGTTVSIVNKSNFEKVTIPLPPLPEQEAIVAKIEELFSELEKGKQLLLTAQEQLKVYRQSLLKWAFEGKLTNNNLPDGQLPNGWKWVKLEEIASVGTGATPLKGKKIYYENGKIPWITSGSLNNEFVKEAFEHVTEIALKETNLTIYPKHTLLLAMYGEGKTRGKCSELLIEATTNQAIAAIHFKHHDRKVKTYLKYFLLKNYFDIRKLSSGGVQPNLNLGVVKKTLIPLPPLTEQERIVEILESKLSVCDSIEQTLKHGLQQVETLRQSILKKAFEGKLVKTFQET